jgi:hypothetical protein
MAVLDPDAGEALVDVGERRLQPTNVGARRSAGIDAETPAVDLVAEGEALEVEEARGALEVGQALRRQREEPLQLGPAGDPPPEHIDEIGIVLFKHPEEGSDVAADVIDHLGARPMKMPPIPTNGS